jgi:hypothetical protein
MVVGVSHDLYMVIIIFLHSRAVNRSFCSAQFLYDIRHSIIPVQ